MSTARPEKLLKNDGRIVTEIVHSVAVPDPKTAVANRAFDTGTKVFTIQIVPQRERDASDECARRDRLLLE